MNLPDWRLPVLIVYKPPLSRAYFMAHDQLYACSIYENRYFTGISPPNWPVPALRYEGVPWPGLT